MAQRPLVRAKEKLRRCRRLARWRARRLGLSPVEARLFAAVRRRDVTRARALVEAGVDPNLVDGDACTLLELAVRTGRTELVRVLLAHGARPDPGALVSAVWPWTDRAPAHAGSILTALLDAGADPNWGDDRCAIYHAVKHPELVRLLLARGGDPNRVSAEFETALSFACHWGLLQSVRVLLAGGANPNLVADDSGWSVLMFACESGHEHVVRALLDAGADPTYVALDRTVLSVALDHGHADLAALLLERAPALATLGSWDLRAMARALGDTALVERIDALRGGSSPPSCVRR